MFKIQNLRSNIYTLILIFCVGICCAQQSANKNDPKSTKPNIIVIMVDDMAQWAMGAYGLDEIETPNMDYLAETGVQFANAMTPIPVCSPARASFHTGKIPSQHGIHDFLSQDSAFNFPWLEGEVLLSSRMQEAGYATALIGKWHVTTNDSEPKKGFDEYLSYNSTVRGWQNQYLKHGDIYFADNGKELIYNGFQAQYLTDRAIDFIDRDRGGKPFFINLNFTEPHAPFEGWPERLVKKYRPLAKKIVRAGGNSSLPSMGKGNEVPPNHEEQLAEYLAGISMIDEELGRIIDAIDGRELMDNTVLVFVSDHGLLVGQYGLYGKVNASQPYNFYEETIRIPLIIKAPDALVRNNQLRGEFVDLVDLHATVLDFAGSKADLSYSPGRSLMPLLQGRRVADWRNYQISERGNARMITDGHWKLVQYYYKDQNKLPLEYWYDLSNPMGEGVASEPPSAAVKYKLVNTLNYYFAKYEDKKWSGRNIWNLPPPNFRVKEEFERGVWDGNR